MATTTAQANPTHCPTCGAKVPRPGMTLCAYCAAPLDMSGSSAFAGERSATLERLQKMKEHADYAEAMGLEPPPGPDVYRAQEAVRRGMTWLAVGVGTIVLPPLVFGTGEAGGASGWLLRPGFFLGLVFLLLGGWNLVRGLPVLSKTKAVPILKRPAIVVDRRSETDMAFMSGATNYYFTLELEEGRAEFRWPGRGTGEDPLVQGRSGLAYTRGDELLAFKFIKV